MPRIQRKLPFDDWVHGQNLLGLGLRRRAVTNVVSISQDFRIM